MVNVHPYHLNAGMAALAPIALLLLTFGCAPASPDSLRSDPGRQVSFTTPDDFLDVYQNEVHALLNCMTGRNMDLNGNPTLVFAVRPRINAAQKTATIEYVYDAHWETVWAVIDIKDNGTGSDVTAYTTGSNLMREFPAMVQLWAHGSRQCPRTSLVWRQEPIQE